MKKLFLFVILCILTGAAFAQVPVTFSVDMSVQTKEGNFNPQTDYIYIRGNFQKAVGDTIDWGGTTFTAATTDDSIYALTINFPDSLIGKTFEYKFVINDGGWESLPTNATYPDGNRRLILSSSAMVLPLVFYSDESVVILPVENTINFTADLSSIYGTGTGFFDPDRDSVRLEGLDWVGAKVVGGTRKMAADPFQPWIFTTSMTIKGNVGDSTKWKLKAYPDGDFFNWGWEISNDKWTKIGPDSSVINIPSFVPDIYPLQPALTVDVKILFQVDMNNAVNRYTGEKIDPKNLLFVGIKGQNSVLGSWGGDWLPSDTSAGTLKVLNDSGTNGDKVAGDGIWSAIITFPAGNDGGPGLYKYGMFYANEDTVNAGYHPMDNEFTDGAVNHYANVKVGPMLEISDVFGDATHKSVTGVKKTDNQTPAHFTLEQNYPNPFNPSTTIKYSIPANGLVTMKIYNILGQVVETLINKEQNAGNYEVTFNASKLSSGVYIYNITTGNFTSSKKMLLLK